LDHRRIIGKPCHEHGKRGEQQDENDLPQHGRSLRASRAFPRVVTRALGLRG
jgi:hypothetical protein